MSLTLEKAYFRAPKPVPTATQSYLKYSDEELRSNWSNPTRLYALGTFALNGGDPGIARRCFERLVELAPENGKGWLWLGLLNQDAHLAAQCYEHSISILQTDTNILAKFLLTRAKDGLEFERKRMACHRQTHTAVVRVRLAHPRAVNTSSLCTDEYGNSVRGFWGWVHLVGFAGTNHFKIRLPDGYEGFTNDNKTLVDIIPLGEPMDPRNIEPDPHALDRSLSSQVLKLVKQSPQDAINLISKRIPEFKNDRVLEWKWYQVAGDIAYFNKNLQKARKYWEKAFGGTEKINYLFAKKPTDIGPEILRAEAQSWVNAYVTPLTTKDFYVSDFGLFDLGDPWFWEPNDVERQYANECAGAFNQQVREWENENGTTVLEYFLSKMKIAERKFSFGIPLSDYFTQEVRYVPQLDDQSTILKTVSGWRKSAENRVRRSHRLPLRGSFIRETLIFEIVTQVLDGMLVVRHNQVWNYLPWLKPQNLDVYVPDLKLAIEYQGAQHFEPIEYFGGDPNYQQTLKRDMRKRKLLEEHGVSLLYIIPADDISSDSIRGLLQPFLHGKR